MNDAKFLSWVEDYLLKLYNNQCELYKKEYPTSSQPESLFTIDEEEEYIFNPSNWNSGQDIVRYMLLDIFDNLKLTFDESRNNDRIYGFIQYNDDDWYGNIIHENNNHRTSYFIRWYKNRGRTEVILKNGYNITLKEYIELILILSKVGLLNIEFCLENDENPYSQISGIKGITSVHQSKNKNPDAKTINNALTKINKNSLYGIMGRRDDI